MSTPGYWPSPWPAEDNGPARLQAVPGGAGFVGTAATVTSRTAVATTMVVLRDPGEVYALGHTAGASASAWVERIDPVTLAPLRHSADLAGGPAWPGSLAAHANGSLYVVFGNHAHRLDPALGLLATTTLPRVRPHNGFVILPDGHLATKDFGGALPYESAPATASGCEVSILEPDRLDRVASAELPEPSIARLSAQDGSLFVVGVSRLWRCEWDGSRLSYESVGAPYRTMAGQSHGWDPVLALGAAWFLDNGDGAERFAGSFYGIGTNTAPLHLVRVDLATEAVALTEICGLPNGLIANPPLIDPDRRIAVGYDSGNGFVTAFDIDARGALTVRWQRQQHHACHPLLFAGSGELILTDHDGDRMVDEVVVVDIEGGDERLRVESGSAIQSVVFPAAGWSGELYYCSLSTIARIGGPGAA